MAENPRDAVIVSAVRTPIGAFRGKLATIPAAKLGSIVVKEAIDRIKLDPKLVEEVIMGIVVSAGQGQNPARQAALGAGLSFEVSALTINKVCGSGLKAVMLAAQAIKANDGDIFVAGGMESMSRAPYLLDAAREGYRMGDGKLIDSMIWDGLWDIYNNYHMGTTGDIIARKYNVTREDADRFAVESNKRAVAAIKEGKFKKEIVTVKVPQPKGEPVMVDTDESPREDTTLEKISKMKPAFNSDGVVTAANASKINDGSSAVVVMSRAKANELGLKPMVKIVDYTVSGVEPSLIMSAPIFAVRKLLEKTKHTIKDVDLYEINEAFSSATVAVYRELGMEHAKLNVNGGAVALGHPIGASGARVLTTLIYAMKERNVHRGIATLCLGGGNAVAMMVESE